MTKHFLLGTLIFVIKRNNDSPDATLRRYRVPLKLITLTAVTILHSIYHSSVRSMEIVPVADDFKDQITCLTKGDFVSQLIAPTTMPVISIFVLIPSG